MITFLLALLACISTAAFAGLLAHGRESRLREQLSYAAQELAAERLEGDDLAMELAATAGPSYSLRFPTEARIARVRAARSHNAPAPESTKA